MASIGEKREWDVSEIEEGASVAVYGILINVSPVRESRKKKGVYHFNAHLSDGKRCVCVVLFDTSHLEVMKKAMEGKVSVLVDDSLVRDGWWVRLYSSSRHAQMYTYSSLSTILWT